MLWVEYVFQIKVTRIELSALFQIVYDPNMILYFISATGFLKLIPQKIAIMEINLRYFFFAYEINFSLMVCKFR